MPRHRALLVAVLGGLVLTAVTDAGFTSRGQAAFAAIAGAAAVVALLSDERAVARAVRHPVTLALLALGALAVVSAAWTVSDRTSAVRWGLVVCGYAAFVVVGAVLCSNRRGLVVVMALIAAVAAGEGLIGLLAAAQRELPLAERIGGSWRPGGSLEYPPALALLQVGALPVLAYGAAGRSRIGSILGGVGLAIAGGTLVTSESRLHLALAASLAAAALVCPGRIGLRRSDVVGAIAMLVGAGVALGLVVGGYARLHDEAGDAGRVVPTIAILLASAGGWLPLRAGVRWAAHRSHAVLQQRRGLVALGVTALMLGLMGSVFAATRPHHGLGAEPSGGFLHGRARTWSAALDTIQDRPVAGSGAQSYAVASTPHERPGNRARFALQLNLELWAELGLAGLALSLLLYGAGALACWRARRSTVGWLAIPAVGAFLIANLLDWSWHLPLAGAVFALAAGAVTASATAE